MPRFLYVGDGRSLRSRALKIIEVENPENVTGFRKLVGKVPSNHQGWVQETNDLQVAVRLLPGSSGNA